MYTMSWTVFVLQSALLVLLLPLPPRLAGLSCSCMPERCEYPHNCLYGMELNACRCCMVCKKGPLEVCGGLFDIDGHCGYGLVCYKNADTLRGVCRWWTNSSDDVSSIKENLLKL